MLRRRHSSTSFAAALPRCASPSPRPALPTQVKAFPLRVWSVPCIGSARLICVQLLIASPMLSASGHVRAFLSHRDSTRLMALPTPFGAVPPLSFAKRFPGCALPCQSVASLVLRFRCRATLGCAVAARLRSMRFRCFSERFYAVPMHYRAVPSLRLSMPPISTPSHFQSMPPNAVAYLASRFLSSAARPKAKPSP